ncbi:hypothetical protein [Rhodococcus sp. ARC_M13]|nr:hypothetical protein [Rhodococcus sp. ARC_M13]
MADAACRDHLSSLSYDFSFLVAGLLSGYLFVMVKDWQQHRRRSA